MRKTSSRGSENGVKRLRDGLVIVSMKNHGHIGVPAFSINVKCFPRQDYSEKMYSNSGIK